MNRVYAHRWEESAPKIWPLSWIAAEKITKYELLDLIGIEYLGCIWYEKTVIFRPHLTVNSRVLCVGFFTRVECSIISANFNQSTIVG